MLSVLRFAGLSVILLLLMNILLKKQITETENPLVLVAIDNSSSITSTTDSKIIEQLNSSADELAESIGDKYTVKRLLFGSGTRNSNNAPDFSDKETDLSDLFATVENNYGNQNIGALIIASDGIYNKGSNPSYLTEKLNYPVYTIALGDTSEVKDLILQKVDHNEVAYLGNNFPVEITLQAKKLNGNSVWVELLEQGVTKSKQKVDIHGDNFSSVLQFTLSASVSGVAQFTARVTVVDGEKNKNNNAQKFAVEVIDNRDKILILSESPHPDIAAIKNSIENSSAYEVTYAQAATFAAPLKPFSLVILHGAAGSAEKWMSASTAAGVPVWIINPQSPDHLPGLKISTNFSRFNDAECFADKTFRLFNISDELRKFINSAPALKTFFGNYSVSNGSSSLINQRIGSVETENPVLLFSETGGIKNAVFAGDGLWKWKLRNYAEHQNFDLFNELISKCIQFLSVKSDKSFFRIKSPRLIPENEVLSIEAEVYNKSYELITEPDVLLKLINQDQKQFNYTFGKTGTGYKLDLGALPAGEYRYEASVNANNEIYKKAGTIAVQEVIAEKLNTVADHQLLFQLSAKSGGKLLYPSQTGQLAKQILANEYIRPVAYTQTSTVEIIDLRWLFWLVLIFFGIEWFFRKRYLTI